MKALIHPQGPALSKVIAGVWKWTSKDIVASCIPTALEVGITTFDHADIYGRYTIEELFGSVLKENPSWRKEMQLVSKCGIKLLADNRSDHRIKHYDTSFQHIVNSAENSLRLLHTDYLDLLLIHRPDPLMQPEEVAKAFDHLQQSGKVKFFGVSNFTSSQIDVLQRFCIQPLVTNQIEVSLFKSDVFFDGTTDTMMRWKMGLMAWSPLGSGKYFNDEKLMPELNLFAEKYKASVAQILLAWLFKHPSNIFPITGTTKPERLIEAYQPLFIEIDKQDWFAMLKVIRGQDVA
ncbi:MAG: aldo/keto reductase [Cyclobacteriaceae bacterium]|nr:aldo/keto reductase [Cyclobacteriaceae bacterium]